MQYSDLTTFIGAMFQITTTSAASPEPFTSTDANNVLPRIIDMAERMIYVAMDMLCQRRADISTMFTAGARTLALPTGCLVVEGVNQISPAGAVPTTPGAVRNGLEPTSLDFIDMCFPTESAPVGISAYWANKDALNIVVGQSPDQAYVAEIIGTFRPAPLSAVNTSCYIATNYPELYMAAVAYYAAGYQRDFGAQSEDPKLASSWKATYESLLGPAIKEEKRRRGLSSATSPAAPQTNPQTEG
jgi:hypothetical protein